MIGKYTPKHYARALQASAGDAATLRRFINDLKKTAAYLKADVRVEKFFSDKTISVTRQEEIFRGAFHDSSNRTSFLFIKLLLKNRQVDILEDIISETERLADAQDGTAHVSVESAVPLSESFRKNLESLLMQKFVRPVVAAYTKKPELIAGLRVTVDSTWQWDGTIAGKLKRLAERIRKAAG